MSASISLDGRLVRDPELKFSNSGIAIATYSIATNERVKNKQTGQYENSDPTFWECVSFGELGENVAEHLLKGQSVLARGTLKIEKYQAKDGTEKSAVKVTVNEIGPNLRWIKPKGESRGGFRDEAPF